MAQIDELNMLNALRQPWVAPRHSITASQSGVTRIPAQEPRSPSAPMRQGTVTYQAKPR